MDCLFCKIASGAIPVQRVYEDEHVLAFPDIAPQAPVHLLLIPKEHLTSHAHAAAESADAQAVFGRLLAAAAQVAADHELGLAEDGGMAGYRLVINSGPDGGQTVHHLHMHLLGGRPMSWPPG